MRQASREKGAFNDFFMYGTKQILNTFRISYFRFADSLANEQLLACLWFCSLRPV